MTIRLAERGDIQRNAHLNGYYNVGFITGILHRTIPNQEPIKDVVWVQQFGYPNLNLCLPVRLNPKAGVVLNGDMQDGSAIHVRVRIEAGQLSSDTKSCIPRALLVSRPNVLNSDAEVVFKASLKDYKQPANNPIPSENFVENMSVDGNENTVIIAGFLVAKMIEQTKSGRHCLSILIQQGASTESAIHFRIYAKTDSAKSKLALYYKKITLGHPYQLMGSYRINPKNHPDGLTNEIGEQIPVKFGYLHCDTISPAKQGDIPYPYEPWVLEFQEALTKGRAAIVKNEGKAEAKDVQTDKAGATDAADAAD